MYAGRDLNQIFLNFAPLCPSPVEPLNQILPDAPLSKGEILPARKQQGIPRGAVQIMAALVD